MGFGILILGYVFLFNVPYRGIDLPPDVLGYAVLLFALHKLGVYAGKLRAAAYLCIPLIATAGGRLAIQLAQAYGYDFSSIGAILQIAEIVILLAFHTALLLGISDLAREVDVPSIVWKAKRDLVIVLAFYAFSVFTNLYARGIIPETAGITPLALFALQQLFGYLLRVLIIALFASCYMRICLEGDEDMPYTPNRLERLISEKNNRR